MFLQPVMSDRDGTSARGNRPERSTAATRLRRRGQFVPSPPGRFAGHRGRAGALDLLKGLPTVVFRAGHVLSPGSPVSGCLRRFGFAYPLVPLRLRSCCVEGDELFAAIEAERRKSGLVQGRATGRATAVSAVRDRTPDGNCGYAHTADTAVAPRRMCTLLGPNRPWKELLAHHRSDGLGQRFLTCLSTLLSFLLVGQLVALILGFLARIWPSFRAPFRHPASWLDPRVACSV